MLQSVPDYIFIPNSLCLSGWSVISLTMCSLNEDLRTHVNRSYFVCIFRVIKVEIFCSVNKEMLLILLPKKKCRSLQFVDTWWPPLLAVTFTVRQLAELMPIPAATWTKKHYLCAAAPRHQEIIHLWKYPFLLFHLPLSIFFSNFFTYSAVFLHQKNSIDTWSKQH